MLQTSVKTTDVLTFSCPCTQQPLSRTFTVIFFVYRWKFLSKNKLLGLRTASVSSTTSAFFWYMTSEGRMSSQMKTLKMDGESAAETPFHLNYLMWLSAWEIIWFSHSESYKMHWQIHPLSLYSTTNSNQHVALRSRGRSNIQFTAQHTPTFR